MTNKELLIHWIRERENIRILKEQGYPKPWSAEKVFQETYFCNVHRENDKVTKWIRQYYSPYVNDPMFLYNIVFSRFINRPETLSKIGYIREHDPKSLLERLEQLALRGKVWGNAYVITTHGLKMPKASYLCQNVLGGVFEALEAVQATMQLPVGLPTLRSTHRQLMRLEGIGSFLSAQILADLKNTPGHPLFVAEDRDTFVAPGPGSMRGCAWFHYGEPTGVREHSFSWAFMFVRDYIDENLQDIKMDNQDLQNCLCEYDKYMRVKNGTGRSKRIYNGT